MRGERTGGDSFAAGPCSFAAPGPGDREGEGELPRTTRTARAGNPGSDLKRNSACEAIPNAVLTYIPPKRRVSCRKRVRSSTTTKRER